MPDKKPRKLKTEDSPLRQKIIDRIGESGSVTVAEYMELAAAHYYATKPVFGVEGDFITAPEVSQMFGEMIGAWFVDLWLQMGQPPKVQLIELGPGRGALMADVMRTLSSWPDCKAAVSLHLVETSPQLRQAQANALKSCRPTWYDRLEEVPMGISFILANEFFDALPIHQLKKVKGEWRERSVSFDAIENQFYFTTSPVNFDVRSLMPKEFIDAHDGCVFEVSPVSLSVMELISKRIAEAGGAALIVDYGHITPGLGDTLQTIQDHSYSDVLEGPGTKDITAHVDFSTLKTVAQEHLQVHGPVTQGNFLNWLGMSERAARLRQNATEEQRKDIESAFHRLTGAAEMGRLFKVMGVTPKSSEIVPAGFSDEVPDDES